MFTRPPDRRHGLSLTEVSVTVVLVTILLGSAYRFMGAEQTAMQAVRQSNLALYSLESLRNRILADLSTGHPFDPVRTRRYLADFRIPFPVTAEEISKPSALGAERILRLSMVVPPRPGAVGRRYTREIELP